MRPRKILLPCGIGFLFIAFAFVACSAGTARYSGMAPERAFALQGAYNPHFNTENYDRINDNPFQTARDNPLSTFSVPLPKPGACWWRMWRVRSSPWPRT